MSNSKPTEKAGGVNKPTALPARVSCRVRAIFAKVFRAETVAAPKRLPSAWQLTSETLRVLWQHRKLFLEIAMVYAVLSIVLVRGLSTSVDVGQLKDQLNPVFGGGPGQAIVDLSVFATLLSSGSTNSGAVTYQPILMLVVTLATVWALRQLLAGKSVRLRDAFYNGMYPLMPFVLVAFVALLQTVPAIVGGVLYSLATTYGIAYTTPEKILWALPFLVLSVVSVYMLCSSLVALYIVALPGMTPMKALQSARELVRYRRASVFLKLFFLLVVLGLIMVITIVPLIAVAAPLAPWGLFVFGILALVVVNAYMYMLYRELLA